MMDSIQKANQLLEAWKGDGYVHGLGVMNQIGKIAAHYGKRALVISASVKFLKAVNDEVVGYLKEAGMELVTDVVEGAKPNAPREDVYRLESYILHYQPDVVVSVGGGSTIDACKSAIMLATYGGKITPEIDHYFGTGLVTEAKEKTGIPMIPMIAVQTSASSGAHLTKYSNITDPVVGQKKLIVDPAIVPTVAFFDYKVTKTMPLSVTIDGELDAIAHTFEVFCGANAETYEIKKQIAETAIDLVLTYAPRLKEDLQDEEAREAIGLATDLGGYAIMVGGTSGAHLTSFSLVDLVAHGTACGIMNPYYAVFYSPAIQDQLIVVGNVLKKHGFIEGNVEELQGRDRAIAVAEGLIAFGKSIGAPTKLSDLKGYNEKYTEQILEAAKDPQLSMKLQNMPIPMTAADVEPYMRPIIEGAVVGDLTGIINK
ncbi:MAG: iron-containing alcohol dehydrogenase [Lachnospiraceae bacterium]|nr:iron-containing alcohol dehydrogenase [Lachnospiraceae bacterium]